MQPLDYFFLQLELEGIQVGPGNLITPTSPQVEDFPLALQVLSADKHRQTYYDLQLFHRFYDQLVESLDQPIAPVALLDLLVASEIPARCAHFKTYIFPASILSADLSGVQVLRPDGSPVKQVDPAEAAELTYAILKEGVILSSCMAVRHNARCAEAWVITDPAYHCLGLASRVVRAWAGSLERAGIIPLYSHNLENAASASLARKLGLVLVFTETVIEKLNQQ